MHFYSRPCGRGDRSGIPYEVLHSLFLLTPLREGRLTASTSCSAAGRISTHAPAGGATFVKMYRKCL